MTAKEKLMERVARLSETEASETLRLIETREDPVKRLVDDAPFEDEEISSEEEAAVAEAREELARGEPTVSHAELKRELGID